MKIIFCLLGLGLSIISFAQLKLYDNKPSVYLDSTKIDLENFLFDQNKIEKIDVVKQAFDARTNTSGSVIITSKKPNSFNFFSYEQIKSIHFSDKPKPILLLLNGNFIKNFAKINIDSSYISKVEVETGNDYEELKNIYPNVAIVNIKLKNLNLFDRQFILQGLPSNSYPE